MQACLQSMPRCSLSYAKVIIIAETEHFNVENVSCALFPSLLFLLWRLPITTFLANFAPVLCEIQNVDVE